MQLGILDRLEIVLDAYKTQRGADSHPHIEGLLVEVLQTESFSSEEKLQIVRATLQHPAVYVSPTYFVERLYRKTDDPLIQSGLAEIVLGEARANNLNEKGVYEGKRFVGESGIDKASPVAVEIMDMFLKEIQHDQDHLEHGFLNKAASLYKLVAPDSPQDQRLKKMVITAAKSSALHHDETYSITRGLATVARNVPSQGSIDEIAMTILEIAKQDNEFDAHKQYRTCLYILPITQAFKAEFADMALRCRAYKERVYQYPGIFEDSKNLCVIANATQDVKKEHAATIKVMKDVAGKNIIYAKLFELGLESEKDKAVFTKTIDKEMAKLSPGEIIELVAGGAFGRTYPEAMHEWAEKTIGEALAKMPEQERFATIMGFHDYKARPYMQDALGIAVALPEGEQKIKDIEAVYYKSFDDLRAQAFSAYCDAVKILPPEERLHMIVGIAKHIQSSVDVENRKLYFDKAAEVIEQLPEQERYDCYNFYLQDSRYNHFTIQKAALEDAVKSIEFLDPRRQYTAAVRLLPILEDDPDLYAAMMEKAASCIPAVANDASARFQIAFDLSRKGLGRELETIPFMIAVEAVVEMPDTISKLSLAARLHAAAQGNQGLTGLVEKQFDESFARRLASASAQDFVARIR